MAAYTQYAEGKYGQPATRSGDAETWWQTPDQTTVLAWGETTALIVVGPDAATVEAVLNTSSATHLGGYCWRTRIA